jgi:hypothetical protein
MAVSVLVKKVGQRPRRTDKACKLSLSGKSGKISPKLWNDPLFKLEITEITPLIKIAAP